MVLRTNEGREKFDIFKKGNENINVSGTSFIIAPCSPTFLFSPTLSALHIWQIEKTTTVKTNHHNRRCETHLSKYATPRLTTIYTSALHYHCTVLKYTGQSTPATLKPHDT
jgi:hypothetical protein